MIYMTALGLLIGAHLLTLAVLTSAFMLFRWVSNMLRMPKDVLAFRLLCISIILLSEIAMFGFVCCMLEKSCQG